jgi:hypothetical protein
VPVDAPGVLAWIEGTVAEGQREVFGGILPETWRRRMETRKMDPIGGGLPLLLDALRFYKLRREGAVRTLFGVALAANLAPVLLPLGKGFTAFFTGLADVAGTKELVAFVTASATLSAYDWKDGLWLGAMILAPVLSMLCALFYANLYVDELEGRTDGKPVRRTFRRLPRLFLLYVSIQVIIVMSGMFLFLPAVVLILALSLAPLLITAGGRRMLEASAESASRTNHFKIRFAFLDLTLLMAMNLPAYVLQFLFAAMDSSGIVSASISAFFGAMAWIMLGRLHGRLYHLLVSQPQDVVPSSEHPG